MSLPSLTSGTSVDTSIHYYHGPEYHLGHHDHDTHQEDNPEQGGGGGGGDETRYPCLFAILNCYQTFTNPEYWKTHVLSHFRTFEPPAIARCPFCPSSGSGSGSEPTSPGFSSSSSSSSSPGSPVSGSGSESSETEPGSQLNGSTGTFINTPQTRAWDALLDHLVSHYQQQHQSQHQHQHQHQNQQGDHQNQIRNMGNNHNQPHRAGKPDFELLRYLYTLRLITEEQWKAAVQLGVVPGSPTDRRGEQSVRQRVGRADEPFWGLFSERRERQRVRHGGRQGGPGRSPGSRHRPRSREGPGRGPGRIVLSSC